MGGEAANRVTIDCWYQSRCGAVGVDASPLGVRACNCSWQEPRSSGVMDSSSGPASSSLVLRNPCATYTLTAQLDLERTAADTLKNTPSSTPGWPYLAPTLPTWHLTLPLLRPELCLIGARVCAPAGSVGESGGGGGGGGGRLGGDTWPSDLGCGRSSASS